MVKSNSQEDLLFAANAVFIEEMQRKYVQDKDSVSEEWQKYFSNIDGDKTIARASWGQHAAVIGVEQDEKVSKQKSPKQGPYSDNFGKAMYLIEEYRNNGHYKAKLDPLGLESNPSRERIAIQIQDIIKEAPLDSTASLKGEHFGFDQCKWSELISLLEKTYSRNIGYEFSHIEDQKAKAWLYDQVENKPIQFSSEEKKEFLKDLIEVESFEQYLHTKFPGAKRFSIEGLDACILVLEKLISLGAKDAMTDMIIGMAHRGRLSTLTKVMGKPYRAVLSEFIGVKNIPDNLSASGDVKYHNGYSSDVTFHGNKVHLSLAYNPSHLEAVNPVVEGQTRAKQDIYNDCERNKVMDILVHGDAAFCGQGIVAESLMMSDLQAYTTGGTVHVITNNQVGFTANPQDGHSGRYCTDIAKTINAPIIHVNADDIESVMSATILAYRYKKEFKRDVVIDVIGYRNYGHNEGDEPMYTQPVMYNKIKQHKTVASIYAETLQAENIITKDLVDQNKEEFKKFLQEEYEAAKSYEPMPQWMQGRWSTQVTKVDLQTPVETGVSKKKLVELGMKLTTMPNDFNLNSKLKKLFDIRKNSLQQDGEIDWATAEQLAFATILDEQIPIRMTGEDACRGTFSHRHAVLHDQLDGKKYLPLNNLTENNAKLEIADSNLSEYGVLGFEYGYSLVDPKRLVIWEAQFGDFVNGSQIIIDQFISAAESKWLRMSGLVMLLPHGFEGMGPEHSSARLERFLQLCAEDNMFVVNPTTPASIFHLLRKQVKQNFRKPLIVMSPKSLLRHKSVVSKLDDLSMGTSFKPVLDEIDQINKVDRLVFCSGKVYYDLLEQRRKSNSNAAIIRLEQYYPFPEKHLLEVLKKYSKVENVVWCQEEPKNMGAWHYIRPKFEDVLGKIKYVGRSASASPAVGYASVHAAEQNKLVKEALNIGD